MNDTIAKSITARIDEIGELAKSFGTQPAATAATGVIAQVSVGGADDLHKSLPVLLRRENLDDDKRTVSDLLYKSLTNENLREDASAALSRLDRVKSFDQLEHFLGSRNPDLFTTK
jgi:DNA-binding ferritin-like protein